MTELDDDKLICSCGGRGDCDERPKKSAWHYIAKMFGCFMWAVFAAFCIGACVYMNTHK